MVQRSGDMGAKKSVEAGIRNIRKSTDHYGGWRFYTGYHAAFCFVESACGLCFTAFLAAFYAAIT